MKASPPFSLKTSLPFYHILLLLLTATASSCQAKTPPTSDYIAKSCQITLYPKVCNSTLAVFAAKIKTNPQILAMAALLVTINTTRSASRTLRRLARRRALKPGEKEAVVECVEEVGDALYELRRSMKELNHTGRGPGFDLRMSDAETWVSAALTDDDTCMDDFTTTGKVKVLVRRLVLRIARLTSITLAFINNYAAG